MQACISRTQMIIHIILGWFSRTAADLFSTSYQAWVWPPWSTVQSRPRNKDLNLKTDLSDSWKQRQPRSALTCPSVDLAQTVLCGREYIFLSFNLYEITLHNWHDKTIFNPSKQLFISYYVKPTKLRMDKNYIIYYQTWAWAFSTGFIGLCKCFQFWSTF